MKIVTSYFGMLKKLPSDFVPVAICGAMKFPWRGLRYTKLAPKREFFDEWKKTGNDAAYIVAFHNQVLAVLTPDGVRKELAELVGDESKTVCLMCYEKPPKFCHRHLVAQWLGADVKEWGAR